MVLPLHVLVVDDHALVRAGLVQMLHRAWPGCRVTECADEPAALLALRTGDHADLVLADVHLPGSAPLQLLQTLRSQWPVLPVVLLTADLDVGLAERAWLAGASAYVTKDGDLPALLEVLRQVLDGQRPRPALLQRAAQAGPLPPAAQRLSPRRLEVLALLADGHSNKEIARRLGLGEPTVKTHLVAIFRLLGVSNRAQAAVAAARWRPPPR